MNITTTAFCALFLGLVACSGAPEAQSTGQVQTPVKASIEGTWTFDLEASDPAAKIREKCSHEADANACYSEIAKQAKQEKIRFADGKFFSFEATADAKENIWLTIPYELVDEGQGHVTAKLTGKPTGVHAKHLKSNAWRIEFLDTNRIALDDPTKGRLVYTRDL